MAQSALKDNSKSPLGIQPFWEKATLEPLLRWENWRTQLKLAILAREGIVVDLLLADPPELVVSPQNPLTKTRLKIVQLNRIETDELVLNKQSRRGKVIVYVLNL